MGTVQWQSKHLPSGLKAPNPELSAALKIIAQEQLWVHTLVIDYGKFFPFFTCTLWSSSAWVGAVE